MKKKTHPQQDPGDAPIVKKDPFDMEVVRVVGNTTISRPYLVAESGLKK